MLYCTLIQAFEALQDWESSVGKALEPMALELYWQGCQQEYLWIDGFTLAALRS